MSAPPSTVLPAPPSSATAEPSQNPRSIAEVRQPPTTRPRSHLGQALNFLLPRWLPFRNSGTDEQHSSLSAPNDRHAPLTDAVEASCLTCAAARAAEESLPPSARLFQDPLARIFAHSRLSESPRTSGEGAENKGTSPRIAIRTRFFDDFVERACEGDLGAKQVVILGAGMDARAYRLPGLRGATVYEVDVVNVLELKESLLATVAGTEIARTQAEKVVRVSADVGKAGWDACLVEAGFDWRQRSAWVLEGLVYYLEEERVESMLRTLRVLSREGSSACMSIVGEISEGRKPILRETENTASLRETASDRTGGGTQQDSGKSPAKDSVVKADLKVAQRTRPKFVFACPMPREFLTRLGFQVEDVAYLGGETANYGRWPQGMEPATNTMYVTFRAPAEAT